MSGLDAGQRLLRLQAARVALVELVMRVRTEPAAMTGWRGAFLRLRLLLAHASLRAAIRACGQPPAPQNFE